MLLKHSNQIINKLIWTKNVAVLKRTISQAGAGGCSSSAVLNQSVQQQQQSQKSINNDSGTADDSTTTTAKTENNTSKEIIKKTKYENIIITTKLQQKVDACKPVVKGFFLGKAETDLLTYPEVIGKHELQQLHETLNPTVKYFTNIIDSLHIDATKLIPKSVYDDMKTNLRSFGADIPQHFGGRGLFFTENLINTEIECESDENITIILNSHRLLCKMLLEYGTDDQRSKYLPQLATGERIGTIGLLELPIDKQNANFFNTVGEYSSSDKTWLLNGEKSFVINTSDANLFLIFAQTESTHEYSDRSKLMTAFLVDKSQSGVICKPKDLLHGLGAVNQSTVKLTDVIVSEDNILGQVGNGYEIAINLLQYSRLQTGTVCLTMIKKFIKLLTKYSIETAHSQMKLMDMELIKYRLAIAVNDCYALESMIYLTGGIIDTYENPDIELETAIIETFGREKLFKIATDALNCMGLTTLLSGTEPEKLFKNAMHIYAQGELVYSLKLFIAYSGLQFVGTQIHDVVKKNRNPFYNPAFALKRLFESNSVKQPKSNLKLNEYLHPSLDSAAEWLEKSIIRLRYGTETLLTNHGNEITSKHIEVLRLSDCAILMYGMFASIGRASRSYCIGLKHADKEMLMANIYSYNCMRVIIDNIVEIDEGSYSNNDQNYIKLSSQIFRSVGYFAEHPTTRNY